MDRLIFQNIITWYQSDNRKPLILKGARQVGKTYSVEQFGREFIEKNGGRYYYIDLKEDKDFYTVFRDSKNPHQIIELIELKKDIKIDINNDLLFIDEIQECAEAISSLKYFEKNMKSLALIVAGSHLGLVKNEESFPVGKVNFLSMFPMTFYEFVMALEKRLLPYMDNFDISKCEMIPTMVHDKLLEFLLFYFAVGGFPEAVARFKEKYREDLNTSLKDVRKIQKELLVGYESDFSKYSGYVNANHIHHVFNSIPKQLSKNYDEEVSKFKFSEVIPKQKGFSRIIGPLTWLCKSRLCIKSFIAKKSGHPLISYTDENVFKVFFLDVGLVNAMLNTPMEVIIRNDLDSYKGYIVENFVAQELYSILDTDLISWKEKQSEIEFVITKGENIVPIEVKSAKRSSRAKSLDAYIKRYHPLEAYKISAQNAGIGTRGFSTIPLYLLSRIHMSKA